MMYSVVDIAGINAVSARILANAAAAMAGMVTREAARRWRPKPLIAASMFGVTTPCVTRARERLEELGYEVLVFHATGTGGQSMEALMRGGFIAGVLDVTTTELARRPRRRRPLRGPRPARGGRRGSACRRSCRSARSTWSTSARATRCRSASASRTALRAQPDRHADADDAGRVRASSAASIAPQAERGDAARWRSSSRSRGVSMIAVEGQPFHDAAADEALFGALREQLDPSVDVRELDTDINDPAFARAMADRLHELIGVPP